MAISTEKNVPTRQTGLGITVVGRCGAGELRIGTSAPGDLVYCLGVPKVGGELSGPEDPETVGGEQVRRLLGVPGVHDLVPVGSQGVAKEAEMVAALGLAEGGRARFRLQTPAAVEVEKSAGPATCLIFTCSPGTTLPSFTPTPLVLVGRLEG